MTDSLGLSIGMTNLVVARVGRPPVSRRSVLTLFSNRAPEVGIPSENPNLGEPGLALSGFVERVGDPVPLVGADGSAHQADRLMVEALDAMTRTVGNGAAPSPIAIAVPAHWGPGVIGALRGALRTKPNLAPAGVPAMLIPDSVAALSSLQASPGLPARGVVVLCDFGGSGTSITLAQAASNFGTIGETVRYPDFSGDLIDQAVLSHVRAVSTEAGSVDPAATVAVESLARLRDECRQAKERLSAETTTIVPAALPGSSSDIRLTRTELETLISEPFAGFLAALGDTLERNRVPAASLAAVATVGGGANIPLITQRLAEALRLPIVTTPLPQVNAAVGSALLAERGLAGDAPTGMATAAEPHTSLSSAAWAAHAAGLAAGQSATDGASSATFRALAWSQDESPAGDPVPYAGGDYNSEDTVGADPGLTAARPPVEFAHDGDDYLAEPPPLPWYKRPAVLFGVAAAAALLAAGGLAITLTSGTGSSGPVTETSTVSTQPSPGQSSQSVAPPTTVTVTGSNGVPTVSTLPPPPDTTTTTTPSPTTTTSPTSTTTTTTSPTTTTTTTTTTPITTTTTPPTTTPPPTTTTTAPPTSSESAPTTSLEPVTPTSHPTHR